MQMQDMVDWENELNRLENLWRDMLHISEQQLAFLQNFKPHDEADLQHLQELLSQRGNLMKQIDAMAGIRVQADKLQQAAQSNNDRDKADALYRAFKSSQDRILPLMLAIKENDITMKSSMSEALGVIGNELVQARQSAKVNRAYTQSGVTPEAWFFDDKK